MRTWALVLAASLALVGVFLGAPRAAHAHQSSTSYSTVRVGAGGPGVVDYELILSTRDLYEALGLEKDRDSSEAEVRAGEGRLTKYVLERLSVSAAAQACPGEGQGLRFRTDGDRRAELRLTFRCPVAASGRFGLDYHLFFDLDPRHVGFLTISHGATSVHREFTQGLTHFDWMLDAGGAAPRSLGLVDFIEKGVEHIFSGYDHILFLIGLLLVTAIRRREAAEWEARGLRAGVLYVMKVVTAFTAAHSLTLIGAAMDWIALPSRFVESAIAASIVYVAVENIAIGDPRNRWPLAFGFGLVHGMGFATMLRPMLPPSGVVVPLLAFNVGVEIGQLTIVGALSPILHLLASRGPRRYQRVLVLGGSTAIGLAGLFWLWQRLFG